MSDRPNFSALKESTEKVASSIVHLGEKVAIDSVIALGPVSERVSRELRQARAVGQFTVLSVTSQLKARLMPQPTPAAPPTNSASRSAAPSVAADEPPTPSGVPGYENLSAAQIIPLLGGLSDAERTEVREYEAATRGRKTILAALTTPVE